MKVPPRMRAFGARLSPALRGSWQSTRASALRLHARLWQHPRRKWWQVLCRVAAGVLLVFAGAYFTFPWWAPVGAIREHFADEMSRQLGLDVNSKRLRLSWRRGIELDELTIGSPGEAGGVPMVLIDQIRADLSPFDLLLRNRIAWMSLENVRLNIRIDKAGKVNAAPLSRLQFGAQPERITVHNAVAVLQSARSQRPVQLNISNIEFVSGRLHRLGRVTMSASLEQSPKGAPVGLRLHAGEGGAAAAAAFSFEDVDLAQLGLERLLKLPLKKLGGRCSGELKLQLNHEGIIDRFSAHLSVLALDAQPAQGPKLPVVERAELELRAAYDAITGQLAVHKGEVSLPDVLDLSGQATLFAGRAGLGWEAVRSLRLTGGTVYPARLAALFTGKAKTTGTLTVRGPIRLNELLLEHRGPKLIFREASADMTSARIDHGKRTVKPIGTKLTADFQGSYDERSGELAVGTLTLCLGENAITGRGRLLNLKGFLARASKLQKRLGAEDALSLLAQVDLQGSWSVRDAAPLLTLAATRPAAAETVKFRGAAAGNWHMQHPSGAGVHLSAVLPSETELAIGRFLAKPAGVEIQMDVSGSLAPAAAAIRGIEMDVSVGDGHLAVDGGQLSLPARDRPHLGAGGTVRVRNMADLALCLTERPHWVSRLAGRISGTWQAQLDRSAKSLAAQADLTEIDLGLSRPPSRRERTTAPAFLDQIQGAATLATSLAWGKKKNLSAELNCDASALRYVSQRSGVGRKDAGVSATIDLAGSIAQDPAGAATLTIHQSKPCAVSLGGSHLRFWGTLRPLAAAKGSTRTARKGTDPPYRITLDGVLTPDKPLAQLLPAVGELARKHAARGGLKVGAEITAARKPSLRVRLDGTDLAFRAGPEVVKPLALPASVDLEAEVSADRKHLTVKRFRASAGTLQVEGQSKVDLELGKEAAAVLVEPRELQVAVWTDRAEGLDALLPSLKPYVLAGHARLEGRWIDVRGGHVPELRFTTKGLRGRHRGKDVSVRGIVRIQNIRGKGQQFSVGRVRTDDLGIRIGKNDLHLVADVAVLPGKPTGELHVVGAYVDTQDIADWLQSSPPSREPPGELSTKQTKALAAKAEKLIASLRPYAMAANLQVRADVQELRSYDPAAGQFYEARHLALQATVARGQARLSFSTLVNGGTVSAAYDVHFADVAPFVAIEGMVRDVHASQEIQSQMARHFPGNTVFGYFNRSEELSVPLRDMLANAVDSRYPLRPKGQSKTITLDGLVEGRAAPKFVAGIFPGLNLAKYRYRRMTAFGKHNPDGTTYNDMVFNGHRYDVYMEGTTDAKKIGRYEVGLILTPQSPEWNHKYRQGRIPLLKNVSRIEGGKMRDVSVSYPWPNETLFIIFLKNNIFYRIWLQSRQK